MSGHAKVPTEFPRLPAEASKKWMIIFGVMGIVGLGATLGSIGGDSRKQVFHSYLFAFEFFLTIGLGGLFFTLVKHLAGAYWNTVVRRLGEAFMGALPVMALLFIPVALGAHDLFHWTHEEAVKTDALLQAKEPYLNLGFFYVRAGIYFAIWIGLTTLLTAWSKKNDQTGDASFIQRQRAIAAPGMLLFALSLTFAAFDWLMSLDPHWYSTIFGVYIFAGSVVAIFSSVSLLAMALQRAGYLQDVVTQEHYHDLGKLLFGFMVFWAYSAFSQFMLIWYGNIPEETAFYLHRWDDPSWRAFSIFLAAGHFAVPFLGLMSRHIKKNKKTFTVACIWMLTMHACDLYWLVLPNLHHHFSPHWLDVTAFVGVGGVFLATVAWRLGRSELVPVKDPLLTKSLRFQNA